MMLDFDCHDITFENEVFYYDLASITFTPLNSDSFKLENVIFRNCDFKFYGICCHAMSHLINCTFEKCRFYTRSTDYSLFEKCNFVNCDFPDGFRSAFPAQSVAFVNCNYDDSFLASASKEWPCPISGGFTAWKKAYIFEIKPHEDLNILDFPVFIEIPVIVKLFIPEDSKRSSCLSDKCRCEKAKVLEIQNIGGKKIDISKNHFVGSFWDYNNARSIAALSGYHAFELTPCTLKCMNTRYTPGQMVYAKHFDEDPFIECGGGIHFFMRRDQAYSYLI